MTSGASRPVITNRSLLFSTPWMRVVGKTIDANPSELPYYAVELADYVSVVPFTPKREVLLVRQFRPAVEEITLEFPSGIVDPGETPEETARREVLEETGFAITRLESLGRLMTDTGRLSNRLWCFYAEVTPEPTQAVVEEGIITEKVPCDAFLADIGSETPRFAHALNLAALCLAQARGLVPAC